MKEKDRIPLFIGLLIVFTIINLLGVQSWGIETILPALIVGVVYAGIVFFIINLLDRKKKVK